MFKINIHDFLLNLGYETKKLPYNLLHEKHYRIPSIGKGQKNNSTDVVLKSNGTYLIYDHATGESYSFNPEWSQINAERDAAQIEKRRSEIEQQRKAEDQAKVIQFKSKANEAKTIWDQAQHCADHPYMAVAGIKPINARTMPVVKTSGGQTFTDPLIIPLFDVHTHKIVNLQFITHEGEKRPLSGAQSQNYYFVIEGTEPTIFVEGYKDACNAHHATGRRVIACITADKIKEIYPILGKQQDAILSDNDNKSKLNDDESRKVLFSLKQINAHGKGHKVATELGAKFYLAPDLGSDAGSMSHDQINALLNDKATSELPIFDVWSQLKDQHCEIETKSLINALLNEKDAHQCAVFAYQYMIRNSVHVPYKKSLIELRNEIELLCVGLVHPVTLDNIVLYVHKRIEFIKKQGLTAVTIQDYKNHNVINLASLDDFKPNYRGVYLIKAPTGSGKTQKVGRPFRDWCRSESYSFLTIAHLRSLIREMSSRMDTAHYDDEKKGIAEARKIGLDAALSHSIESLSVCLPSLANELFKPFINDCKHVFIDEISQVIETFNSDKLFNKTDIEHVYQLLKVIIKNAECVIVADANINQQTLDFIESCRMGEKLNIVEVAPTNENKTAHLYNSFAELQSFLLQRVMVENQNVWITCDSKTHVQTLQAILNDLDIKNIAIVGNENIKKETAAFLKNPEIESLNYQVVISTSAIASGVSIEHDHFGLVAGFFTGSSVQPTDAYQMLGRVRQCKEFHIYADQSRRYVMDVLDALQGKQQASVLEGSKAKITEFSLFKTELEKVRETRRSNFANNLIWILENKKFTVKRVQQFDASGHAEFFKCTKDKIKADHKEQIKAAYKIDAETAQRLQRKDFLSDPEAIALQAYEMRMQLGLQHDAELNEEHFDIDLGQLIRFNAFLGRFKPSSDKAKDLAVRRYREAMGKVYRLAFDGVLMQPNAVFTETGAKLLIQQVTKYRLLLAAIGAIPTRFGMKSWKPSEYAARDLNEILKYIGINFKRCRNPFKPHLKRKLSVQMPHNLYIRIGLSAQITDEFAYKIDAENFGAMQQLCDSLFNASVQNIRPEDMQQLASVVASVGKPDFVSDVVSLDDVQINIESIPLVTTATEQQLATGPSNDGVFIDVMQQLTRSDLMLDDLHHLREYAEQLLQQHDVIGNVQQVSELDLINSMISSRALQG